MKSSHIYSDRPPHGSWRKKHLPTIAILLALALIAAWAALFLPALIDIGWWHIR